jgi:hypothetical protein
MSISGPGCEDGGEHMRNEETVSAACAARPQLRALPGSDAARAEAALDALLAQAGG